MLGISPSVIEVTKFPSIVTEIAQSKSVSTALLMDGIATVYAPRDNRLILFDLIDSWDSLSGLLYSLIEDSLEETMIFSSPSSNLPSAINLNSDIKASESSS